MTSTRQRPRGPLTTAAAVLAAATALSGALVLTACGTAPRQASGPAARPARTPRQSPPASPPATPSPSPSPPLLAAMPVAPGSGALPQTMARPRAYGPAFHAMITDLWLAVRTGRPGLAWPAFFPEAAYKQVKAIWDPGSDWRYRLWLDFTLDIKAAHALLGPQPGTAQLVRVIVPAADAVWVGPGACYNRVGYWHVANPRVVYRLHGQIRSFGIASLISWRGVWYVVHFGGVVRGAVGMVDAPQLGPGYPGPQGGC